MTEEQIEDLMDKYMDDDLTTFNKVELKKIKKVLMVDIKSVNKMLDTPLHEHESDFYRSDLNGLINQVEEINAILNNK